jgi:hypothetical protein
LFVRSVTKKVVSVFVRFRAPLDTVGATTAGGVLFFSEILSVAPIAVH